MSPVGVESELFQTVLTELHDRGFKLAIAESLTGGLVSSNFVSIEGASKVFLGSVVAYQDSVKHSLLGVTTEILETRGAVSVEAATSMAAGVRNLFARDTGFTLDSIASIATTGQASPNSEPHGLVFVAAQLPSGQVGCAQLNLAGTRNEIRDQAATAAANLLLSLLRG
jgi:nicotinamide-nucleotide amidase